MTPSTPPQEAAVSSRTRPDFDHDPTWVIWKWVTKTAERHPHGPDRLDIALSIRKFGKDYAKYLDANYPSDRLEMGPASEERR